MVEPVSTACAVGATTAAVWAAELVWDLAKGAVGNELHLQLRQQLPSAYAKFTRDKLPPNHDLEKAVRQALERALLSFATGLQATTDRNPSAFRKAMAYLRHGPEFVSTVQRYRREEEGSWLQAFRALVIDEQRMRDLEVITADTARGLLATQVNDSARELLHKSVQQWVERHMTQVPGWPAEWQRCLDEGWAVNVEGDERVTLYQAWAIHFREAIKHRSEVFNIFVAGELADGIPAAVCAGIDSALRTSLDTFANQILQQLDRIERKLDEALEKLIDLQARMLPAEGAPFAELPPPTEHFTGRSAELAELVARLTRTEPGAHVITAGVQGMGGIGKTALALAVGHAARAHFRGGTLFFSLHAHSATPLTGLRALFRWLELRAAAANMPAPQQGDDLHARFLAELARAPGPVLVVVDDPASEADVRALHPRRGDGLLVTSRKPIAGLQSVPLKALPMGDAAALLRSLSARALSGPEAEALASRCAQLPVALQALGRFLARRPNKPVVELLQELDRARLPTLVKAAKGDAEYDVYIVLHYSLQALAADERAALRALCAIPGDFNRGIGTSVVGGDADMLDALGEAGVLDVQAESARYLLHDLMREVALTKASPDELEAASLRHAEALVQWVKACNQAYESAVPGAAAAALAAFSAERTHLDAALAWLKLRPAHAAMFSELVWRLEDVAAKLMHPLERLPLNEAASLAATGLGDSRHEAAHLGKQAQLKQELGQLASARILAGRALELHRRLAHELTTVDAQRDLSVSLDYAGQILQDLGEFPQAYLLHRESLEIRRVLAREQMTPEAWRDLTVSLGYTGDVVESMGDWLHAEKLYGECLEISRALADKLNTVEARRDLSVALNKVGLVIQARGDWPQAEVLYREGLEISRGLADELNTPEALSDLSMSLNKVGRAVHARGDWPQAETMLLESREICRGLADALNTPRSRRALGVVLTLLAAGVRDYGSSSANCAYLREAELIFRSLVQQLKTEQAAREHQIVLSRLASDCPALRVRLVVASPSKAS